MVSKGIGRIFLRKSVDRLRAGVYHGNLFAHLRTRAGAPVQDAFVSLHASDRRGNVRGVVIEPDGDPHDTKLFSDLSGGGDRGLFPLRHPEVRARPRNCRPRQRGEAHGAAARR